MADQTHDEGAAATARKPLRDYQARGVDAASAALRRLCDERAKSGAPPTRSYVSVLLCSPTASGKTRLATEIILRSRARRRRVAFLTGARILVDQAYAEMVDCGVPESEIGVIMAGAPRERVRPGAPIQIGTIGSLYRRAAVPRVETAFLDEAHHATAHTWHDTLERLAPRYVVGLTATPARTSGRPLGDLFDELITVATTPQLIEQGHLAPVRCFSVPPERMPDLRDVKKTAGDYNERGLAEAVEKADMIGDVVEQYRLHGRGHRAVAFCVNVREADRNAQAVKGAGIAADYIHGGMSEDERRERLDALRDGRIRILFNANLLIEGFNMPEVRVAILLRPTASVVVHVQQVGRVLRLYNGEWAFVIDHVGNLHRHGLPDKDFEWSLADGLVVGDKIAGGSEPRKLAKRCDDCGNTVDRRVAVCDLCGKAFALEAGEREVVATDGQLIELPSIARARALASAGDAKGAAKLALAAMRVKWDAICREAIAKGYLEGWARRKFEDEFKEPAGPATFPFPERPERRWSDGKRRELFENLRGQAFRTGHEVSWAVYRYEQRCGEPVEALVARERAARLAAAFAAARPGEDLGALEARLEELEQSVRDAQAAKAPPAAVPTAAVAELRARVANARAAAEAHARAAAERTRRAVGAPPLLASSAALERARAGVPVDDEGEVMF